MATSGSHGSDTMHPDASYAQSYYQGSALSEPEGDLDNYNIPTEETQETSNGTEQQSLEQLQNEYYVRGIEELDTLQLLDLSPLATWKLLSAKQGHGLEQLRDDNPNTYWQSDGSINGTPDPGSSSDGTQHRPHSITLQFSKKVSLERISLFCNYHVDESYTPLRIRIMAGSSSWDLREVCVVDFDKPVGWSHIIFLGVRGDGLLKCFVVQIIVLSNHQDGKDSHIRAIRCFGKKSHSFGTSKLPLFGSDSTNSSLTMHKSHNISGNYQVEGERDSYCHEKDFFNNFSRTKSPGFGLESERFFSNVVDVIGFNTGFDTIELKSVSGIR